MTTDPKQENARSPLARLLRHAWPRAADQEAEVESDREADRLARPAADQEPVAPALSATSAAGEESAAPAVSAMSAAGEESAAPAVSAMSAAGEESAAPAVSATSAAAGEEPASDPMDSPARIGDGPGAVTTRSPGVPDGDEGSGGAAFAGSETSERAGIEARSSGVDGEALVASPLSAPRLDHAGPASAAPASAEAEPAPAPAPWDPEQITEPMPEPITEPVPEPTTEPPAPMPVSPAPAGPLPDMPLPDAAPGALADEVAAELTAQAAQQSPAAQAVPRVPESGEWRGVVLVTGTDTDVGKTIVTSAIAAAAQAAGLRVAVIKPGQTGTAAGGPTDIDLIKRLAAPHTARTLASYPDPLAPLAAARVADLPPLELYEVVDAVRAESASHDLVLVEGAGGLLVQMGVRPSGEPWTLADLATTLGVSTIVVSRAGLGTLNHTALTLEALARRGVPVGVVLGAWPAEPELVHWANLSELLPNLVGALPEGAGAMEPGVFRRSAPGWLTPALYGVLDDWRVWAEEVS